MEALLKEAPTALPRELPGGVPPPSATLTQMLPYLFRLVGQDRRLWLRFGVAIATVFLAKACNIASPILFKEAVDALTVGEAAGAGAGGVLGLGAGVGAALGLGAAGAGVGLAVWALMLSGALKSVGTIANELRSVLFTPVAQAAGRRVSLRAFEHVLTLDAAYHLDRSTGALSRILDRGARATSTIFRAVLFTFVPTMVEFALVCWLLAKAVSWQLSLAVIVTFALYISWTVALTQRSVAVRKEVNRLDNLVSGKSVDALLNVDTVTTFTNEEIESRAFNLLQTKYQDATVRAEYVQATLNGGQGLIVCMGLATVLSLAAMKCAAGQATPGDVVLVNGLVLQLWAPLSFLGWFYRNLRQAMVDMENLFALLRERPTLRSGTRALPDATAGGMLRALKEGNFANGDASSAVASAAAPAGAGVSTGE
eukprot:PRCOL_00000746-RA